MLNITVEKVGVIEGTAGGSSPLAEGNSFSESGIALSRDSHPHEV